MTKSRRFYTTLLLASLFLSGAIFSKVQTLSAKQTTQTARPEHVILISVDGMPPDYYTAPEKLGLRVPTLTMLKQGGAYAEGVEGVYPTADAGTHVVNWRVRTS